MSDSGSEKTDAAEDYATDAFFNGRLKVHQPRNGYRYSIDAVILAHFAGLHPAKTAVDLGTGCGVIPLILAFRRPELKITGVEIQPGLAGAARRNIRENGYAERISIIEGDLKDLRARDAGGRVDLAVSNPPYRKAASGRINPVREKAMARHEIKAALPDVLAAAARLLRTGGRLAMIYPAERLTDLLTGMRAAGMEPKTLRTAHSRRNDGAILCLAAAVKGGRPGLKVAAPLVIYGRDGGYTPDVSEMFNP